MSTATTTTSAATPLLELTGKMHGGTPIRWWVLWQVSFLSFNQSLFWITFSPIAEPTMKYYAVDNGTVLWWLNVGVVAAIVFFPLSVKLMESGSGVKRISVLSAALQAGAMISRLFAVWAGQPTAKWSIVVVYVAQFTVGAVGPLVMAVPPLLSAQWFPPKERATATAIASLANNFGSAVGFILGIYTVVRPSQIPRLLYIHAGLAALNLVMILAHFPAKPAIPPSAAAGEQSSQSEHSGDHDGDKNGSGTAAGLRGCSGILKVVTNPWLMLVAIGGGTINGVFNVWSASLVQLLQPMNYTSSSGHTFDQNTCGWLGFGATLALIVGGVITGAVADLPPFNRRMKETVVTLTALTAAMMVYFTLALPNAAVHKKIFPSSFASICVLITLSAFVLGGSIPLMYELGAEMTYPVPASTSSNVIVLILNIGAFIFLFIANPLLDSEAMNLVISGVALLAVLLLSITKVDYRRQAAEAAAAETAKKRTKYIQ